MILFLKDQIIHFLEEMGMKIDSFTLGQMQVATYTRQWEARVLPSILGSQTSRKNLSHPQRVKSHSAQHKGKNNLVWGSHSPSPASACELLSLRSGPYREAPSTGGTFLDQENTPIPLTSGVQGGNQSSPKHTLEFTRIHQPLNRHLMPTFYVLDLWDRE